MIVGGLIILWVEGRDTVPHIYASEHIGWKQAIGIGFAQCLAMIPGTSRSGATIVGGMLSGVSGFVAAFISALFVVNAMIRFVAQHSLRVFAWYRIALGLLIGVGIVTSAGRVLNWLSDCGLIDCSIDRSLTANCIS